MTTQDNYWTFTPVCSTLAMVTPVVKQWQGITRNELTTRMETRVSFLYIHAYIYIMYNPLFKYSKMNVQDGIIWIVFANHINCHSVQKSQDL